MSETSYAFSGATKAGALHHRLLAELDDIPTLGRIQRRFPAGMEGMRVWEVGCGDGALSRALVGWVGPGGQVVATDRDITRFGQRAGVDVRMLNLVTDRPPEGKFHLIHVRKVLSHLPDREAVLATLVDCLAPGGHILLEDWVHPQRPRDMLARVPEPTVANHDAYIAFQSGVWRILTERGHDRCFGMDAYEYLDAYGLVNLESGTESTMWPGGGIGCQLQDATLTELDGELAQQGVSRGTKATVHRLLNDPEFVLRGMPTYWTWGEMPKSLAA